MRRRLFWLVPSCAALWFACSDYDDAIIDPPNDAGSSDVATSSSSSSSSSGGETPSDAGPDVVDARADAEAGACVDPCDCDNDTYVKPSCYDAAASDAGFDCDDSDPRRHPGQGYLDVETEDGDWNCDQKVEKKLKEGTTCEGLSISCTGNDSFYAPVACGKLADFFACTTNGPGCAKKLIDQRRQECR